MKKIIAFAVVALITSVASAGNIGIYISPEGPAGTPVLGNPFVSGDVGTTGTLYVWVDPAAGKVNGVSLDVTPTDPAVVQITGGTVYSSIYNAPPFVNNLPMWNPGTIKGGTPDAGTLKNMAGGAVTEVGIQDIYGSAAPAGYYVGGNFLFGSFTYQIVGEGVSAVNLSIGQLTCNEEGGAGMFFFGAGETEGIAGATIGGTGLLADANITGNAPIPEPTTGLLALFGLLGLIPFARRK